jgi:hypothetical protein
MQSATPHVCAQLFDLAIEQHVLPAGVCEIAIWESSVILVLGFSATSNKLRTRHLGHDLLLTKALDWGRMNHQPFPVKAFEYASQFQ